MTEKQQVIQELIAKKQKFLQLAIQELQQNKDGKAIFYFDLEIGLNIEIIKSLKDKQ